MIKFQSTALAKKTIKNILLLARIMERLKKKKLSTVTEASMMQSLRKERDVQK